LRGTEGAVSTKRPALWTGRMVVAVLGCLGLLSACSPIRPSAPPMASKIALTASDLTSSWKALGQWEPPAPALRAQLYACLNSAEPALRSQAASRTFISPTGVVAFSVTSVFPTSAEAAEDLSLQRNPRFPDCESGIASQLYAVLPPGLAFGAVSGVTLPIGVSDASSEAYQFTAVVSKAGTKSSMAEADSVTVLRGTVESTVTFVCLGPPPSTVAEAGIVDRYLRHW